MTTTVFFATDPVAQGNLLDPASYSARLQKANDPTGLIYGSAFVDGADLTDNTGLCIGVE